MLKNRLKKLEAASKTKNYQPKPFTDFYKDLANGDFSLDALYPAQNNEGLCSKIE